MREVVLAWTSFLQHGIGRKNRVVCTLFAKSDLSRNLFNRLKECKFPLGRGSEVLK